MRQIAFYGKGGIGKSTISSNIAASLAQRGLTVLVIGCDPKHDCTRNLTNGKEVPTILDTMKTADLERYGVKELIEGLRVIELEDIVVKGYNGIYCAESGGPKPGVGCAGRGVIAAIETLKRFRAFEILDPDIVIYDVLGDVVCGGFAMPLRMGLADEVYIVTSSDYMSLYAVNNICAGIKEFVDRGGSPIGGVIHNVRGAVDLDDIVLDFAIKTGSRIVGKILSDMLFMEAEIQRKTVIEYAPDSELSNLFRKLAWDIYENKQTSKPKSLNSDEMSALTYKIGDGARELKSMNIQ